MLERLARNTLLAVKGNALCRKALAFAILVKDHNTTSTFKDWSYRDIAKAGGVSPNTAKRYVTILRKLHLAASFQKDGHSYLVFKKLRRSKIKNHKNHLYHTPKSADIALSELDRSSVGTIEKGLAALCVKNTQVQKDHIKRLIKVAYNPSKHDGIKSVRRARAVCRKRGWSAFTDNGISYRGLARTFKCSFNTVKKIIAVGESLGMFWVEKRPLVLVKYIGGKAAKFALPYFKDEYPTAFATANNIYIQPSLVFHLFERTEEQM